MDGTRGNSGLLYGDLTAKILGAFFAVHRELGWGFLESVYANAVACELGRRGLKIEREVSMVVRYSGVPIGAFRADAIVERSVLLEYKAVERIPPEFERKVLNYLCASDLQVGLLLNFGPKATFSRVIHTRS